jgi:2-keto-3-deoxy-L-fuconate dehydrogenase
MAAEGAKVYATGCEGRVPRKLQGVSQTSQRAKLDVLDDAAVKKMIGELPPLDSSSTARATCITARSCNARRRTGTSAWVLNVRAMYVAIQRGLPKMVERFEKTGKGASIINMASVAGSIKGIPNRFVYGTSKAAVIGSTKSVAADFVQKASAATASRPGPWTRRRSHDRINAFDDPVEARKMFIARQPMGRLAKAEEIAPIVIYSRVRRIGVSPQGKSFQ